MVGVAGGHIYVHMYRNTSMYVSLMWSAIMLRLCIHSVVLICYTHQHGLSHSLYLKSVLKSCSRTSRSLPSLTLAALLFQPHQNTTLWAAELLPGKLSLLATSSSSNRLVLHTLTQICHPEARSSVPICLLKAASMLRTRHSVKKTLLPGFEPGSPG